jgi:hypothetical protein
MNKTVLRKRVSAAAILLLAGITNVNAQTTGNVGIGTSSPTNTLHVDGTVRITNLASTTGTNMVTVDNNGVLAKQALPAAAAPTIQATLGSGVTLSPSNWSTWNYTGISVVIPANSKYVIFGTFYMAASPAPSSTQALTLRVSVSNSNTTFTQSPDIAGSYYISGTLPPVAATATMSGTIVINNTASVATTYYLWAGRAGVFGSYTGSVTNFGASTGTYFEDGVFAMPIN